MKDNLHVIAICILGSFVVSMIVSNVVVKNAIKPYQEIQKMKDSLSIQHNSFYFTIEKDTIITKPVNICIGSSSSSY